jgi:hypothetical protein
MPNVTEEQLITQPVLDDFEDCFALGVTTEQRMLQLTAQGEGRKIADALWPPR